MVDNIDVKKSVPVYSPRPVKRNTARDQALASKKPRERRKPGGKGELGQWVDDYA